MPNAAEMLQLGHGLTTFLRDYGYLAAFILLFIEEAGVPLPVPGDGILIFLGHQAATGTVHPALAFAVVVVATTGGASVLYAIAARFGRPLLTRYGRFLHLDGARLDNIEGWIQYRPGPTVVAGRLIPGFRTATSVVSGTFEIPYPRFAFFTAVASSIWAITFMSIGASLEGVGRQLYRLLAHQPPAAAAIPLLAIALLIMALLLLRGRNGGPPKRPRMLMESGERL